MSTVDRIIPVLTYRDIPAAHDFLVEAFGFVAANSGLFVDVDDVDADYQRARAAGARIDSEPVDQPYGQREYGARDLEGHRWWFATPVSAKG